MKLELSVLRAVSWSVFEFNHHIHIQTKYMLARRVKADIDTGIPTGPIPRAAHNCVEEGIKRLKKEKGYN